MFISGLAQNAVFQLQVGMASILFGAALPVADVMLNTVSSPFVFVFKCSIREEAASICFEGLELICRRCADLRGRTTGYEHRAEKREEESLFFHVNLSDEAGGLDGDDTAPENTFASIIFLQTLDSFSCRSI